MATPIIFLMRREGVPLNIIRTHNRPQTGMFHSFRFLSCLWCFKFADSLILVISHSYLFLSWKWVGFLRNQIQRQLSKTLTRKWHSKSPFFDPNTQPTFLNYSTDGKLCSRKVCFPSYLVYYVNTTFLTLNFSKSQSKTSHWDLSWPIVVCFQCPSGL